MCVWVVVLVHLTLALFKDQVYFQFFVEKITDLHFSGVSYWKIIMFYRWYDISLIFHIFWSFVFLFSRLKEQSPPPIYMLADFRRELPSLSPARYSQGFFFFQIFSTDTPAPYFLFPCGNEFLRLFAFWVPIFSCLLSWEESWILKFMYFLSILQIWDSFLHMITSYLHQLALAALGNAQGAGHLVGVCVYVSEALGVLGVPMGQWGESSGKASPVACRQTSWESPWCG